jgi:hypothetical protein
MLMMRGLVVWHCVAGGKLLGVSEIRLDVARVDGGSGLRTLYVIDTPTYECTNRDGSHRWITITG